ncbi:MAG TPA: type II toxin-antitoxin system Phd/YefM family antitoxin, partial [Rhodocyclaceae bacterium]|nr:type II toxin-antitoxin system Phd/YefM family antitoxin [Rhodocyclaceae bacterium]
IVDLLAMPGIEDIDFEPVRASAPLFRPADLS